jgi:putative sterol carrier protein
MGDLQDWLDGIEPSDLDARFASVDAEEIARLIGQSPDAELRELIDDDDIRAAALSAGFGRFAEFAVPERLAEVSGAVRFVVSRAKGIDESYDGTFADGTVVVEPSGDSKPDLVISTDALTFLRLLSGTASAALLVLAGDIRVEGDEALALQVGGVFRVPGTDGVAVDPSALNAVEVAKVISGAKDSHLRHVMSGGFRNVVLDEIFRRFPEYLDDRRAAKLNIAACFKIGGGSGDDDRYLVEIDKGTCTVTPDGEGKRNVTIALGGTEFLKLATGNLNPTMAFMKGSLKIKGDLSAALALSSAVRIPSAKG